jgi:hypothetical protein
MNEDDGGPPGTLLEVRRIVHIHPQVETANSFVGDVFLDGDLFHVGNAIHYSLLPQLFVLWHTLCTPL